jgi:hypothetical protein
VHSQTGVRERGQTEAMPVDDAGGHVQAGGGYRHQGHVAFDSARNKPLCNLYARMLQQMGVQTDRFGSSDGVIREIG